VRGTRPPASATNSAAPQSGPDATPSSGTRRPSDGDRVDRRFVDAVESEELVGQPVVVTAEGDCADAERGRREQDVLSDVPGLEQGKPITAQSVLRGCKGLPPA
jgi:hypothetical protein